MAAANAGEQLPERVKHLSGGIACALRVLRSHFLREQRALDGGVLAIGFDMHGKVAVIFSSLEAVMFLQSIDLRLRDSWDLAFVGIERSERGSGFAAPADLAEGGN